MAHYATRVCFNDSIAISLCRNMPLAFDGLYYPTHYRHHKHVRLAFFLHFQLTIIAAASRGI